MEVVECRLNEWRERGDGDIGNRTVQACEENDEVGKEDRAGLNKMKCT